MKYGFLTTLIPKHMEESVRQRSRYNMQDAANSLQWHIYEGLCANIEDEIKIFNILPIGSFPQYYSKAFVSTSTFDDDQNKRHVNIGFCNVKLLRKWHQPKKIFARLNRWCSADDEPKTLFVYTFSGHFVAAVSKLKSKYPSLKVCFIVADLPDMTNLSSKRSLANKLFEKRMASSSYSRIDCADAFVLLTRQMADYMKITQPFVVMEGISTNTEALEKQQNDDIKRILYTGTLHKKFGVLNLVEAFGMINDESYRLIICGVGDSAEEIKKAAAADPRIEFKGQLRRDEVLALQKKASVLVNPRQNNEEFTKYSFPSKNLEYLSSGIPLVAYKLDGIPDEYDRYINYVSDNSMEALRDKLVEIGEDANGSASARAEEAVRFVREEKNSRKQTLKIKKMLEAL